MATWVLPGKLPEGREPESKPQANDGPPDGLKAAISDSQGARRVAKPKGEGKAKINKTPRYGPVRAADRSVRRERRDWAPVSPTLQAAFLASMVHNLPKHGKRKLQTTVEQKREDRREALVTRATNLQFERKNGRVPPGPSRPQVCHNGDLILRLRTRDIARLFKRDHPSQVRVIVGSSKWSELRQVKALAQSEPPEEE